jgi:hypothetical protein
MEGKPEADTGFCSDDPRVLGHRADQTAASVISWKLGMPPTTKGTKNSYVTWKRKDPPSHASLIACGGVRDEDLEGVPYV